jgi:ABC-type polysaccharide/polyol phosphate transport system ATPase subunit
MADTIIEIRNLKKYYDISQKGSFSFVDVSDILSKKIQPPKNVIKRVLDDINLDIYEGECFGIIGANGTGKSTLLKLISGIIQPDSGSVKVKGSLIPLLSLGVGFSDELTAHDNVYQYGMILGFSRKEMDALYDDIIEFSELAQYQHMFLRNFSTGMRVKLAFATASRIQPDVLVLDEVLAVGDISFKAKSRQKILDFVNSDKTVVIVSHSMSTISELCDRAMFLQDGKISSIGDPSDVIDAYLSIMQPNLKPKEIVFAQKVVQVRAEQENDRDHVNRVINRVTELQISPVIRSHYSSEVEQSLNEYLAWENLKKTTYLEGVNQVCSEESCEENAIVGSSLVSFIKELGDKSKSRTVAGEIVRNICKDGFVCYGDDNLMAFITGTLRASDVPAQITTLLIFDGSKTIPVIFSAKNAIKIDHCSALAILEKARCEPGSGATLVLSPELYTDEGIADMMEHAIPFLAPVPVRNIEEGNFNLSFFEGIALPDSMLIYNDRPLFVKKGRFTINGTTIDGFGYLNPRLISSDYTTYFKRMEKLGKIFESTIESSQKNPDVLISEIAKKDAIYFSGSEIEGHTRVSFNADAVHRRQKLMGNVLMYHNSTWNAQMCYRNYEVWKKTAEVFNYYRQIITSNDALTRGKSLLLLINSAVGIGLI